MMKMKKIKMNWPLLDLSASPQVKSIVLPYIRELVREETEISRNVPSKYKSQEAYY